MGTIRFELRPEKKDKDGRSPVRIIYQISGERRFASTSIRLLADYWDVKGQRAMAREKRDIKKLHPTLPTPLYLTSTEIQEINDELASVRIEFLNIERRFEMDQTVYSAAMVIDTYLQKKGVKTKKEGSSNIVFEFIDRYIADNKATREAGSLAVYRALRKHLEGFETRLKTRITFDSIDHAFFQSFQAYLLSLTKTDKESGETVPGLNNTTIAKQLSTLKTFLNYAKVHGVTVSEKYKTFKIKRESLEVIALTSEEFETLFSLDLVGNKRLEQTRDIFCFACSTGLRYSDLSQLRREHIKEDEIRLTVKKTKEWLTVPLNKYSKAILDKYAERLRPLPMISNQKLNDYVKELCKLANIDESIEIVRFHGAKRVATIYPKYELIGVHTGRKTFATLSLEKGMSAEEVMTITGHKDYKSFKRYVKVTEQRKKVVMKLAWGGVNDSTLKAV